MADLTLRVPKGTQLTQEELDANLLALLAKKDELGAKGDPGNSGLCGATFSTELPINPDTNPESHLWIQYDPITFEIIGKYNYIDGEWIISLPEDELIPYLVEGHNYSTFLPPLGPVQGYLDNSWWDGYAACNIPDGWITFYKPVSGYSSCFPAYTFAYKHGPLYTGGYASYFELLGSITLHDFALLAQNTGMTTICGGSNTTWAPK